MSIDTDEAMSRHYIPDGVEYSGQHDMAVTKDWMRGWDACKELADAFPAPKPAECEPVAWMNPYGGVLQTRSTGLEHETYTIPLFTAPQPCQRCEELSEQCRTNHSMELDALARERDELQAKVAELTQDLGLAKITLTQKTIRLAQCEDALSQRDVKLTRAEAVIDKVREALETVTHIQGDHHFDCDIDDIDSSLAAITEYREGK